MANKVRVKLPTATQGEKQTYPIFKEDEKGEKLTLPVPGEGERVVKPMPDQGIPENPAKAFTNRPGNVGLEAAPGVPWEYVDEETIKDRPIPGAKGELTGGMARGPIKEGVDMAGALDEISRMEDLIKPPGGKPGAQAKVSDYSAAERDRFRQQVIDEHLEGVDPVTINPFEILEDVEQNVMPMFFDQFFQKKRLYEDWENGRLSKEEEAAWMDRYQTIRAKTFNMAKAKRQFGEQLVDEMMGRWDAVANDFHARLQDIRKRSEKQRETAEKSRVAAEKSRTAAATTRKANVSVTKDVLNAENNIKQNLEESETPAGKDYKKTGKIPAGKLRQLNTFRKTAGMPALKEVKEGKKFTYKEEGQAGGVAQPEAGANVVKDLSPEDEKLLKGTFPNAIQDKDGQWMAPNAQGQYEYIVRQ